MLLLFNFHKGQIFVDFVGFLPVIIYEVLYTRCLGIANVCSTWFLDIRISTCFLFPLQYKQSCQVTSLCIFSFEQQMLSQLVGGSKLLPWFIP